MTGSIFGSAKAYGIHFCYHGWHNTPALLLKAPLPTHVQRGKQFNCQTCDRPVNQMSIKRMAVSLTRTLGHEEVAVQDALQALRSKCPAVPTLLFILASMCGLLFFWRDNKSEWGTTLGTFFYLTYINETIQLAVPSVFIKRLWSWLLKLILERVYNLEQTVELSYMTH